MAPFDECCVLIPSATLEDFPSNASDFDARSMLAGWTVLWHPRLLAQTEQLPTWYRADSPPDSDGPRIVVVPTLSADQLPRGYETKCQKNPDCRWITGASRDEMLDALQLDPIATHQVNGRRIGMEDFFAAGFVSLQIQVMTRRLRYTSNLDEIHLQSRVVAAAKALVDGSASDAVDALHDVFDCLAEERDHYFSSDPHLIDLNLLAPSTLDKFVNEQLVDQLTNRNDDSDEATIRSTPANVLINHEIARIMAKSNQQYGALCDALSNRQLGWAGGDPDPAVCLDAMTFGEADRAVRMGHELATEAVGKPPAVYSRFTGASPADLTPTIVSLKYEGMIPIDFSRGTGFGDEAKVIRQGGGAEIQALTAKPIDANSDASFLCIGARLGESIDSGEIATGLLVHWPGAECDSFRDLKRAASWSLALGRFWLLDDYFTEGEHPYHHGSARSVSSESSASLSAAVEQDAANPISSLTESYRDRVSAEASARLQGMIGVVAGETIDDRCEDLRQLAADFAKASGASNNDKDHSSMLCVNPQGGGIRSQVQLDGYPPERTEHIYGASSLGSKSDVSIDVPAYGFAAVQSGERPRKQGSLFNRMFSGPKKIADGTSLSNRFMEVSISPTTGGIQGIHSGQTRGNRFSLRLVQVSSDQEDASSTGGEMKADRVSIVESTEAVGVIKADGKVLNDQDKAVATFSVTYRLERGSRYVELTGSFAPEITIAGDPWRNYLGIRIAVSTEAAILRPLVRDKVHRSRGRRMVSPLGLVIDEVERQTLVASKGLTYHRRVSDRFVDTLLTVQGESNHDFELAYGFDISNPVAAAYSTICGALDVPVVSGHSLPPRGWILNTSPSEVLISAIQLHQREDGRLAAIVRVIQSRPRSTKAVLRFCRDVQFATILDDNAPDPWNVSIEVEKDLEQSTNHRGLDCDGDAVRFSLTSHEVAKLLIVFAGQ